MTPMDTLFFVDLAGNYLGGFAGCTVRRTFAKVTQARVSVETGIFDENGAPFMREELIDKTEHFERDVVISPALPSGAFLIDAPPTHGAAVLRDFTISDGKAVGGTWDYSAVPQ